MKFELPLPPKRVLKTELDQTEIDALLNVGKELTNRIEMLAEMAKKLRGNQSTMIMQVMVEMYLQQQEYNSHMDRVLCDLQRQIKEIDRRNAFNN